jgi:hypothetical protein
VSFEVHRADARTILTPTCGFIAEAGFTHSLSPAHISDKRAYIKWHEPEFQAEMVERMRNRAARAGRRFGTGTRAFGWLAEVNP